MADWRSRPLSKNIDGPLLLEWDAHLDQRGYFLEAFNSGEMQRFGLPENFFQDSFSLSYPGVLRGLHCQIEPLQGKFIQVVQGKVFDVVVDLRSRSSTLFQHSCIELGETKLGQALWIPEGFAHGFCVLGHKDALVYYKMTTRHNPKTEEGILWNDPFLNINWPIKNPILSERDQKLLSTERFKEKFSR